MEQPNFEIEEAVKEAVKGPELAVTNGQIVSSEARLEANQEATYTPDQRESLRAKFIAETEEAINKAGVLKEDLPHPDMDQV